MTDDNEPTAKLDVPVTAAYEEPPPSEELPPRVLELRDRLEGSGWLDIGAAAGLGFLVLLAVGGVLVLAAKLNYPQLGGGADLLSAFNALAMAGLGTLGIPLVIDGVVASALPLGALAVVGAGVVWAVRTSIGSRRFETVAGAVTYGARVGIPFGLLCGFFALVFRSRGAHPVAADAGIALLAGAFWGALFGSIGAVRIMEPLRAASARLLSGLRAKDERLFTGASVGAAMLAIALVLAFAAALLWIIVALAKDPPGKQFSAGDAFAYVVYLIAFLPNILVGIVTLSFGAPIDVGAKIDVGGRFIGPFVDYSLFEWGRGDAPIYLWLLVLIPLAACGFGGFYARRKSEASAMVTVLLTASGVVAVCLTLLASVGVLRMAGVLKGSGFALIAPDVPVLLLVSFLVSGVVGFLGWKVAERTDLLADRLPHAG